jgi:hypothetical protein
MSSEEKSKQDDLSLMVDRFLSWKLPETVNPDCGKPIRPYDTGTNLLTAAEARQMLEHVVPPIPVEEKLWNIKINIFRGASIDNIKRSLFEFIVLAENMEIAEQKALRAAGGFATGSKYRHIEFHSGSSMNKDTVCISRKQMKH